MTTLELVTRKVSKQHSLVSQKEVRGVQRSIVKCWLTVDVADRPVGRYQPLDWASQKKSFKHLEWVPFPELAKCPKVDRLWGNQATAITYSKKGDVHPPRGDGPVARLTLLG